MAFRRRRAKVRWVTGTFDVGEVNVTANVQNFRELVTIASAQDFVAAGDVFYVRRIVGVSYWWPQVAGGAGVSISMSQGIALVNYVGGAVAAVPTLLNSLDFEDQRWIWRRDYQAREPRVQMNPESMHLFFVDWRGIVKLNEGRTTLAHFAVGAANMNLFQRLRVLLQEARR